MAGCGELANAQSTDENVGTRIRRTILLTDGLANVGITDPQQLSHHAGELRRRGIATTTIGVGQNFDEGLLSAMAEAGGGNFQYAENANAMREFFSQELQSLLSVVATGLTVTLQAPETSPPSCFPRFRSIQEMMGCVSPSATLSLWRRDQPRLLPPGRKEQRCDAFAHFGDGTLDRPASRSAASARRQSGTLALRGPVNL